MTPLTISTASLADLRREIRDAMLAALEAERAPGGVLTDVQSLLYGNSQEVAKVKFPAVWIQPGAHEPVNRGGHTMSHPFEFDVTCWVYNAVSAEAGEEEADDLMARCYDVLMQDRSLGGTSRTVEPRQIFAPVRSGEEAPRYVAAVRFAFTRERRET